MSIIPGQENLIKDTPEKLEYYFFNPEGQKLHKTKEVFKATNRIVVYPYFYRRNGQLVVPKIKSIEFKGWSNDAALPADFRNKKGIGIVSPRFKLLMRQIKRKFPAVARLVVSLNGTTRIEGSKLYFTLADLSPILIKISRILANATQTRIETIDVMLHKLTPGKKKFVRKLDEGKLSEFLQPFELIDSINDADMDELTRVLKKIPASNIKVTENFIQTREALNMIYLEEVIQDYTRLMTSMKDNEEAWQKFFENNAWILSHLFPYEVILRGTKAFLGGKTWEDKGGKLLDFLFENGLKDNHALLEIKTHVKPLMKTTAYRGDDVFAVSDDLSGGINQCLDYKDHVVRSDAKDLTAYDPPCILIIGQKKSLSPKQKKSFELVRANQKNVVIATFDEVLDKLKALQKILVIEKRA